MHQLTRTLLCLLCLSAPAFAQENPELEKRAEQEVARGNELLSEGKYEEAKSHFARANALLPEASGPYAGLGFALKGLGLCGEALPNFRAYLARAPNGASARDVLKAIEQCQKAKAQLSLRTEPDGAAVAINSPRANMTGSTPQTFLLPPGAHTVTLSKEGHAPVRFRVDLEPGKHYELPLIRLSEAQEPKLPEGTRAPVHLSLLVAPSIGLLSSEDALGFKVTGAVGTSIATGGRGRLRFGSGAELGLFRDINAPERTLRFSTNLGWDTSLTRSEVIRLGVESQVGLLLHQNNAPREPADPTLGRVTRMEAGFALRSALIARFSISPKSTLLFAPVAFTFDPTDAQNQFRGLQVWEILSVGYEQSF